MNKAFIQERYKQKCGLLYPDLLPVSFTIKESEEVKVEYLPNSGREIHICNNEDASYMAFFGHITKQNDIVKIHIRYCFRIKEWDLPLSPTYHVNLLKKMIEWKKEEVSLISDVRVLKEEEAIFLSYFLDVSSILEENTTLHTLYGLGKYYDSWGRNEIFEFQENIGREHLKKSNDFSLYNLLDNKELITRIESESDSNKKGKLLENLISRLFSAVEGFDISNRVITSTEEIDISIINESQNSIWAKESPLILVECKNWSSKCGKNELVVFKEKIINRFGRAKVGFFISWNGFSEKFDKELLRSSQGDIIIILLTGKQIKTAVSNSDFGDRLRAWWLQSLSR